VTSLQSDRIKEFESEVRTRGENAEIDWKESGSPESRGVLFGDSKGITLMVYPQGLISIPAVRSYHPPKYPTPVIAAASAKELWAGQKRRDDANPERARDRKTGHLGPIVDPDLKCRNVGCRCHKESPGDRQKRALGGRNTNPNRCS
jgi:hypothetical protein